MLANIETVNGYQRLLPRATSWTHSAMTNIVTASFHKRNRVWVKHGGIESVSMSAVSDQNNRHINSSSADDTLPQFGKESVEVTYFRLLPKTDFRTRPLNAPGNSRRNSFLFICFTLEETSLHFSFTLFTHEKRQRNLIFPVCKTEKKKHSSWYFFSISETNKLFFQKYLFRKNE